MNLSGMPGGGGGAATGLNDQEAAMLKAVSASLCANSSNPKSSDLSRWQMQGAMESCPVKTVISGGMGFALGGAFGLFMSSVRILVSTFARHADAGLNVLR